MKARRSTAFSFIELMTVVALLGIVASSATPIASTLFQRHREMLLRERLLLLRTAIDRFSSNGIDDDKDGSYDEDPRGDANMDGFPGIKGIDDDGDLFVDEDWANRSSVDEYGRVTDAFDWMMKADDDEDGINDEEAFPSDLNELCSKMTILQKRIPLDPTMQMAVWGTTKLYDSSLPASSSRNLKADNDRDWTPDGGATIILSADDVYDPGLDIVVKGVAPAAGTTMTPLVDEDPRDNYDNDGDGRKDEDPAEIVDVYSLNSAKAIDLTSYCEW